MFLPETADLKMPDSLEEIEEFGKDDVLFWMPICKSRRRFKTRKDSNFMDLAHTNGDNKGYDEKHDF